MNRTSSFIFDRLREILMKRYAVEKVVGIKKLTLSFVFALISFIFFQLAWIIIAVVEINLFLKIILEIVVISALAVFWRLTWGIIGKLIPKFVWIGLLGWFFIAADIIPNLVISSSWSLSKFDRENIENRDDKIHGISLPAARFFSLNEQEIDEVTKKAIPVILNNYIELFIAPYTMPAKKAAPGLDANEKIRISIKSDQLKFCRYILILFAFILFSDIFLSVSIYKQYGKMSRFFSAFSIHAREREKNVKRKLILFSLVLLLFSMLSLNYYVLFWVLSFLTTIFIFRWEIKQRGQNHKPLSRSVLFVFLTQIFSSISGEILFLTLVPVYTLIHGKFMVFNIYDSIVLGWTIILGSSVTVLFGIVTQVIWSGRRMTEVLKD